jgi:hypothetical protein
MMRWLGVLVVSAGLALGACGSSEKKKEPVDTGPTALPVKEALVGGWTDGTSTLKLMAGGAYSWVESRPCGAPPCPSTSTSGTWQLRNDKIYLDPADGGDEIISFDLMDHQSRLVLTSAKQDKTWSLNRQ